MKKITTILVMLTLLFSITVVGQAYEVNYDEYDFGGETITFASNQDYATQFEEGEDFAHLKEIEDKFNVNIEFRQIGWQTLMNDLVPSIMAGEPLGDVVEHGHRNFWNVVPQGVLLPLNEVLENINYWERLPEFEREYQKEVASYAGLVLGFSSGSLGRPSAILWNKSFFEREGLPDLYELQNNGEWTWDKFKEIVEKSAKDIDGDGEFDQWGYTPGLRINPQFWLKTNNVDVLSYSEDGDPVLNIDSPAAMETYNYMFDLINRNLICRKDDNVDRFWDGDIAMMRYPPGSYTARPEDLEDEFGLVLMPKGPRADKHVAPDRGDMANWRIPITSENPEALVELTNALFEFTEPYIDTEEYYEEMVEDFAMEAGDQESIETYKYILHNRDMVFYHLQEFNKQIRSAIIAGNQSISAAVEAGFPTDQSRMDDVFTALREHYGDFSEHFIEN